MDDSLAKSVRNFFLCSLEKPVVLKKFLNKTWHCLTWDIDKWVKLLGDKEYPFHFAKKISTTNISEEPQWEYRRIKSNLTFKEFIKWTNGETIGGNSVLNEVSSFNHWGYFNYYYFKDIFNDDFPENFLSWDVFGFPEIELKESTLWIGTAGANTPCHLDTYGSNIVCQIFGRKRWTLFPKEDSNYLYPTRVPYEESSVYSKINFPIPNVEKFPKILKTSPYVVTLEAGDVLLVPKHWWHFVENLDLSISVNTWIPLTSDKDDRLKEAFILYQTGALCQSLTEHTTIKRIFNPNMIHAMYMDSSELNKFIRDTVLKYFQEFDSKTTSAHSVSSEINSKKIKYISFLDELKDKCDIEFCKKYTFEEYCNLINVCLPKCIDKTKKKSHKNLNEVILNAFTDQRVIDKVKEILDEELSSCILESS